MKGIIYYRLANVDSGKGKVSIPVPAIEVKKLSSFVGVQNKRRKARPGDMVKVGGRKLMVTKVTVDSYSVPYEAVDPDSLETISLIGKVIEILPKIVQLLNIILEIIGLVKNK